MIKEADFSHNYPSQKRKPHPLRTEEVFVSARDHTRLSAEISYANEPRDSQGVIVFVHGFAGNKHENGLFSTIADEASNKGFHSVMYDWRGIGDSGGTFQDTTMGQHVEDFKQVVQWTRGLFHEKPISAVGFSLGAAVVGTALAQQTPLDSVAYISPAARPNKSMWPRYEAVWQKAKETDTPQPHRTGVLIGQPILESLRDTDLGEQAFTTAIPLYVAHGTNDAIIDISHTRQLVGARIRRRNFTYKEIEGASHSLRPAEKHWKTTATEITDWLS